MEGDIIDISPFFVDNCYMEPKTSIKQHDFISGEPRHKYLVFGDYDFSNIRIRPTNPCGEISLGDPQRGANFHFDIETGGLEQGELGVVMAPSGVGKTGIFQRMMETLGDNRQVANFDFQSLYPEVQRLHHIVPEGHVTTRDEPNAYTRAQDFMREVYERRMEERRQRDIERNDMELSTFNLLD